MKMEHKKIFHGPSKILKNISWPINVCLKYFMAPTKILRFPSYILNVRSLKNPIIKASRKEGVKRREEEKVSTEHIKANFLS